MQVVQWGGATILGALPSLPPSLPAVARARMCLCSLASYIPRLAELPVEGGNVGRNVGSAATPPSRLFTPGGDVPRQLPGFRPRVISVDYRASGASGTGTRHGRQSTQRSGNDASTTLMPQKTKAASLKPPPSWTRRYVLGTLQGEREAQDERTLKQRIQLPLKLSWAP